MLLLFTLWLTNSRNKRLDCGIGCSENYTFLKIITEHSRNLYIGQLKQDETKNYLIRAVLVFRNGQNILQGNLAKNTKKKLEFQFFAFYPLFCSQLMVLNHLDQFVWSRRFFWYPYWHSLWHLMSYGTYHKMS